MTLIVQLMGCGSILTSLALVIPFWFKAAIAHNDLVKFQYENAPEAWEKSGERVQAGENLLNFVPESCTMMAPTKRKSRIQKSYCSRVSLRYSAATACL